MKLLLDVGNSRVKWAVDDGGALRHGAPFAHAVPALFRTLDDAWGALPRPRRVWVCCVAANRFTRRLERWLDSRWGLTADYLRTARRAAGVTCAYPHPGQLGVDRWAAVVGARHAGHDSAVIVDSGTATTIDLLAAGGRHRGGWIVPGLGLAHGVLNRGTGRIDVAAVAEADALHGEPADNTRDAVQRGVLHEVVALVDRVVADLQRDGERPHLLLTGGDAARLAPLLGHPFEVRPGLVLEGAAVLARNARGRR